MGNMFSNAKVAKNDKVEQDFSGGGGLFDTDLYSGKIKYAYVGVYGSGSKYVEISVLIDGREMRDRIIVTNREGEVTYKDKKSGELRNLPGFNQINALCMILASKELGAMDIEDRTLNLWDSEARAEKPKSVECLVELHDQDVMVAIQQFTEFKQEKGDDGKYHDTDETRNGNDFQKFFPAAKAITISEIDHHINSLGGTLDDVLEAGDMQKAIDSYGDDQGPWVTTWLERNRGQVYDKTKGKAGKSAGKSFDGNGGGADAGKKKASLFD